MLGRVLLAAILAGIAAGLVMSVVQHWRVTPLILAAETYETTASAAHASAAHASAAHEAGAHAADESAWAPADGLERTAFTVVFNVLAGVAFALLAVAASLITGIAVTPGNGALWGLAGFATFMLAPSAGLPPELPGMAAGELAARQLWWWLAVGATAAGIGLLAVTRHLALKGTGILVIALPHLIGAPHPESHPSAVPAGLANAFAANALVVSAIFWIVLGVSLGVLLTRGAATEEAG